MRQRKTANMCEIKKYILDSYQYFVYSDIFNLHYFTLFYLHFLFYGILFTLRVLFYLKNRSSKRTFIAKMLFLLASLALISVERCFVVAGSLIKQMESISLRRCGMLSITSTK